MKTTMFVGMVGATMAATATEEVPASKSYSEHFMQAKEKARDTIEMFLYQHGVNKYLNEGSEKA